MMRADLVMRQASGMPPLTAPHAHDPSSVQRIMLHVGIALLPTTAWGLYLFGWPAVNLWVLTCVAALATESLCLRALRQPQRYLFDGSALLTGWLLALTLPPWAPWWVGVGGAAFAIAVGKHLYGGIGQNVFNPAMLARVALLISFPLQLSTWVLPMQHPGFMQSLHLTFTSAGVMPDGSTGATALGHLRTSFTLHRDARDVLAHDFSLPQALLGHTSGSLGETSELLLALGGAWMLALRIISWEIPLSMLLAVLLPAALAHAIDPGRYAEASFHLSTGGLLLGALFIATDPVTSPVSRTGRLIFGAGCGLITWIIRSWGSFPEGVAFAVLFMNALSPLLDRYCRPRVYGRNRSRQPLRVSSPVANVKGSGGT